MMQPSETNVNSQIYIYRDTYATGFLCIFIYYLFFFSSFMTYHQIVYQCSTTGTTCRAGTTYTSEGHCVVQYLVY